MKTCRDCGETKPLTEYYKDRVANDGHQYQCKECSKEQSRLFYWKQPHIERSRSKKYWDNNLDKSRTRCRRYQRKRRGITTDEEQS